MQMFWDQWADLCVMNELEFFILFYSVWRQKLSNKNSMQNIYFVRRDLCPKDKNNQTRLERVKLGKTY